MNWRTVNQLTYIVQCFFVAPVLVAYNIYNLTIIETQLNGKKLMIRKTYFFRLGKRLYVDQQ